ncbi:MAG: IS4 family transposase [Thermodesulfobacteriota bacterium]
MLNPSQKQSPKDFTRNRKLSFSRLLVFILSLVAGGKAKGVDVKSGVFFRNAKRSGLWLDAEPVHRSALTKARKKVEWRVFEDMLGKAVQVAYRFWPESPEFLWHGMSVYAVDGSAYELPATEEIRREFDPKSGLQYAGKGHYPQCLVSTLYDVFRRLPIARTVAPVNSSEREQAKLLMPYIPAGGVVLFDRGYPGFQLIRYLLAEFTGYFIFRCPARDTFPAVERFIRSGKEEDVIRIEPSVNFLKRLPPSRRKEQKAIKLRIVKLVSPDGTVSVLLTNLYDKSRFPCREIVNLYFRRWGVESYYRDEKTVLEIETFHGKTCNSIRQELLAAVIMSVISRTLMALCMPSPANRVAEPQFKNAMMTLASEAAVLASNDPETALQIFDSILKEISRVRYYRPKHPRPPQPRVTKRRLGKWAVSKTKKVEHA